MLFLHIIIYPACIRPLRGTFSIFSMSFSHLTMYYLTSNLVSAKVDQQLSHCSWPHNWHSLLDQGAQIGCTFFDLSETFDSVPQQALLNKLHQLSVPPILINMDSTLSMWPLSESCDEWPIIQLATGQIWGTPRFHPWPPSVSLVHKWCMWCWSLIWGQTYAVHWWYPYVQAAS